MQLKHKRFFWTVFWTLFVGFFAYTHYNTYYCRLGDKQSELMPAGPFTALV